ncbi:hypothetical protein [Nitrosomonas supralitoralis]|uniref:Uncharacterized protein n=1 Tax=Nitrosomonas supralitoralis TaxID=2116706 RepID=A0A2P7NXY8_9PROT|nr:hypothetical protein [Nitrosomonas supralitoralis]PSJ18314.1 hypothetical protein C7H79_03790 [Nitrosomonas supralitoralis]
MKTQKFIALISVLIFSLTVSSAFAVEGIDDNNHAALAEYYEIIAKETEAKLQKNKAALEDYEAHPYYYGRRGQDFKSHTIANIRGYEAVLTESLNNANLHKRLAKDQDNSAFNKARLNFKLDTSTIR